VSHTQVQFARGTAAQVAAYTGPVGEIIINTTTGGLHVQDGVTAGGSFIFAPDRAFNPSGRLTLTSATPVLNANTTAAGTVYYTPFTGNHIPIYNGIAWASWTFSELSLVLDSNAAHTIYHASGALIDFFVFSDSGTLRLGTGPWWTSLTARGTGAGTTELIRTNGILTNKNSMTARFGNASGNTVSVPANTGTYVGTMYATANGQTGMNFTPAAAAGGAIPILALYNHYNKVPVGVVSQDSTASWTYASTTVRAANNSSSNCFYWVDGTQESEVHSEYTIFAQAGSGNVGVAVGLGLDSITAILGISAIAVHGNVSGSTITASAVVKPQLGLHYISALEVMNLAVTGTFSGGANMLLRGRLSM
jgi:hypothetical protein